MDRVTIDRSYFELLLRRADLHTSTQLSSRLDPANVTISRGEYDSLLRTSREYDLLKNALFAGGLTADTLSLLIASGGDGQPQPDSATAWDDEYDDQPPDYYNDASRNFAQSGSAHGFAPRKAGDVPHMNLMPTPRPYTSGQYQSQARPNAHSDSRRVSYGVVPSSAPSAFDEADSLVDGGNTEVDPMSMSKEGAPRTLYFVGFNERTSYRDLLSVVKGGKVLNLNMRSERSATLSFLEGAAEYLAWVKRNGLYLNGRRVEVRWADRQLNLNSHIRSKIENGATRNLLIRNALEKNLTAQRIRDDMEHICGLVIIDIAYQNGIAYVSTNAVHNALFARTCMMSRAAYKGCKIEFYPDECDVALPMRPQAAKTQERKPVKNAAPLANRFHMLNMDSADDESDEENRDPLESDVGDSEEGDDDTINVRSRHGVRLDFLDGDSRA